MLDSLKNYKVKRPRATKLGLMATGLSLMEGAGQTYDRPVSTVGLMGSAGLKGLGTYETARGEDIKREQAGFMEAGKERRHLESLGATKSASDLAQTRWEETQKGVKSRADLAQTRWRKTQAGLAEQRKTKTRQTTFENRAQASKQAGEQMESLFPLDSWGQRPPNPRTGKPWTQKEWADATESFANQYLEYAIGGQLPSGQDGGDKGAGLRDKTFSPGRNLDSLRGNSRAAIFINETMRKRPEIAKLKPGEAAARLRKEYNKENPDPDLVAALTQIIDQGYQWLKDKMLSPEGSYVDAPTGLEGYLSK